MGIVAAVLTAVVLIAGLAIRSQTLNAKTPEEQTTADTQDVKLPAHFPPDSTMTAVMTRRRAADTKTTMLTSSLDGALVGKHICEDASCKPPANAPTCEKSASEKGVASGTTMRVARRVSECHFLSIVCFEHGKGSFHSLLRSFSVLNNL